jgi:CorA-like Mg2+ transporter protein
MEQTMHSATAAVVEDEEAAVVVGGVSGASEPARPTLPRFITGNDNDNNKDLLVNVRAYEICSECDGDYARGTLDEVALSAALGNDDEQTAASNDNKLYWIDAVILGDIPNGIDLLHSDILDHLPHIPPFLRRHLHSPRELQKPQVLALPQAALIVVRILSKDDHNEIRHAGALCLPNLLLTVTTSTRVGPKRARKKPFLHSQQEGVVSSVLLGDRDLPDASVGGALCLWLELHLRHTADAAHALRTRTLELVHMMDQASGSVQFVDIVDLKDRLLRVSAVVEEQTECLENVTGGEIMTESFDFSPNPHLTGCLKVLKSTAGSTERMVFRLEKRIKDLRQSYDANQQDRINRRLSVLTIMSAIFLPLTLIAGIYGMNFVNMPVLRNENGYYYSLATMAAVVVGLIFTFWFIGWLS